MTTSLPPGVGIVGVSVYRPGVPTSSFSDGVEEDGRPYVETVDGRRHLTRGDYVVSLSDGGRVPLSPKEFEAFQKDMERRCDEQIRKKHALLLKVKEGTKNKGSFFFRPFKWQEPIPDLVRRKNTTLIIAPNKIGKTGIDMNIAVSWALGFEPWNEVKADYPGAVPYEGRFYKPSSLGTAPPVRIRITGEDWTHSVGETIVPELRKWCPAGTYTTKKNTQSIEYLWTFKNGSTIEIMTHDQDPDLFESWLGHGWIADEPPPRHVYTGMSRGVFATGGKILIGVTPLKEAWLLDELVLTDRPDVGVSRDLTILDNDETYEHDSGILKAAGLSEVRVKEYFRRLLDYEDMTAFLREHVKDGVRLDECFLKLKFQRFIKDTPEEERDARIKGTPKHLVGIIMKRFNREVHVVDDFIPPPHWPVLVMIDFHPTKQQAIQYHAFDEKDRQFTFMETWEHLPPEEIAADIIRKKRAHGLRMNKEVFIDPLAKGDDKFMKNRFQVEDSFRIIEKALFREGLRLVVASKDKTSGIQNVQRRLMGPNKIPTLFICKRCTRTLYEIVRWVYDDDGSPMKENDDMMECLYRSTLTGVKYTDPKKANQEIRFSTKGVV